MRTPVLYFFKLKRKSIYFTIYFEQKKATKMKWGIFFQDFEILLLNSHESLSIFLQMSNCNCFDGFRCDVLVDPLRSWQFIWDFAHFDSDFHQFLPSFTRSLWTFPLFLHHIFVLTIFFTLCHFGSRFEHVYDVQAFRIVYRSNIKYQDIFFFKIRIFEDS